MANEFYTEDQVAGLALRMVEQDSFLSALIARDVVDPLKGGGASRTIELRIPNALVARERDIDSTTAQLIFDELTEASIVVGADKAAYSGVKLSDGDLSLNLKDFGRQVLAHQVDAVVEKVEGDVAAALRAIPKNTSVAWDEAHPERTFTAIRREMRKRGVPLGGLQTVVGVNVYAALLDADLIQDASASGSTAALREGNVGKIRGFNIVESTRIDDDEIVALHRDTFSLSVRPPVVPAGAAFGTTVTSGGFGLRYVRGFDINVGAEKSLVDTMYAIVKLPMYKITRNETTHVAEAVELAAGQDATFRMSTTDTEPTP